MTVGRSIIDLLGQSFGSWTVIERAGYNAQGRVQWACRCACGNEAIVSTQNLRRGISRSCAKGTCHPSYSEKAGYTAAHRRVYRAKGSARKQSCVDCGERATEWSYDHEDPAELVGTAPWSGITYSLDPEHYQPRCKSCHVKFDHKELQPA